MYVYNFPYPQIKASVGAISSAFWAEVLIAKALLL